MNSRRGLKGNVVVSGADQIGSAGLLNLSWPAFAASAAPPSLAAPVYLPGTLVNAEAVDAPLLSCKGWVEQLAPSSVEQMLAPPSKTVGSVGSLRSCCCAPRREKSRCDDCNTPALA